MAANLTDDSRARQRLAAFRSKFVRETPPWYRGEYHLAFTLFFSGGVLLYAWSNIHAATVGEWLLMVPIALFGNWAEWAGHRYLLHRPTRYFKMAYKRHCGVHHQFFTNHDLTFHGQKEWRALLFPPFAPVAFIVVAIPPAAFAGWLISANAGYIVIFTMAAYYLMYEGLHTLSHLDDKRHPYLKHIPLVNTVRRMHVVHHMLGFMQTRNFNLTFPICDAFFGTSDLDRGLIGTLFNGTSEAHVRRDLQPEPDDRAPFVPTIELGKSA